MVWKVQRFWRVWWKKGIRDFWLKLNIAKTAPNFLEVCLGVFNNVLPVCSFFFFSLDFSFFSRYSACKNISFPCGICLWKKQWKRFVSLNNETNKASLVKTCLLFRFDWRLFYTFILKTKQNIAKQKDRTLFNTLKQTSMWTLELFWQCSILAKTFSCPFPPNPLITEWQLLMSLILVSRDQQTIMLTLGQVLSS